MSDFTFLDWWDLQIAVEVFKYFIKVFCFISCETEPILIPFFKSMIWTECSSWESVGVTSRCCCDYLCLPSDRMDRSLRMSCSVPSRSRASLEHTNVRSSLLSSVRVEGIIWCSSWLWSFCVYLLLINCSSSFLKYCNVCTVDLNTTPVIFQQK